MSFRTRRNPVHYAMFAAYNLNKISRSYAFLEITKRLIMLNYKSIYSPTCIFDK
jgi:hypothetical protein